MTDLQMVIDQKVGLERLLAKALTDIDDMKGELHWRGEDLRNAEAERDRYRHIAHDFEQQMIGAKIKLRDAEAERDRLADALDAIEGELGIVPLDQLSRAIELAVSKAWAMAREKRPDPELIPAPIARAALAGEEK